jgi:hypothetical protein
MHTQRNIRIIKRTNRMKKRTAGVLLTTAGSVIISERREGRGEVRFL